MYPPELEPAKHNFGKEVKPSEAELAEVVAGGYIFVDDLTEMVEEEAVLDVSYRQIDEVVHLEEAKVGRVFDQVEVRAEESEGGFADGDPLGFWDGGGW